MLCDCITIVKGSVTEVLNDPDAIHEGMNNMWSQPKPNEPPKDEDDHRG